MGCSERLVSACESSNYEGRAAPRQPTVSRLAYFRIGAPSLLMCLAPLVSKQIPRASQRPRPQPQAGRFSPRRGPVCDINNSRQSHTDPICPPLASLFIVLTPRVATADAQPTGGLVQHHLKVIVGKAADVFPSQPSLLSRPIGCRTQTSGLRELRGLRTRSPVRRWAPGRATLPHMLPVKGMSINGMNEMKS